MQKTAAAVCPFHSIDMPLADAGLELLENKTAGCIESKTGAKADDAFELSDSAMGPGVSPRTVTTIDMEQMASTAALGELAEQWGDWKAAPRQVLTDASRQALVDQALEACRTIQANKNAERAYTPHLRTVHAKCIYATTQARLLISPHLPEALASGFMQPGASLRTIVRCSNSDAKFQSDDIKDVRAMALRIVNDACPDQFHDMLMTSGPEGIHGKDAKAIVTSLIAARHTSKAAMVCSMIKRVGCCDGIRMGLRRLGMLKNNISLASLHLSPREPFALGENAVKFRLVPANDVDAELLTDGLTKIQHDELMYDFVRRLTRGDVRYNLQIQGYCNPKQTPMNDARIAWDAPWLTIGQLCFPHAPHTSQAEALNAAAEVNKLAFNPFNVWDDDVLTPIGEIHAVRRLIYQGSAEISGRPRLGADSCPFMHS